MATTVKFFNSAGAATWLAPPGVTSVKVEGYGAGGSGSNGSVNPTNGGGGAGGAYAKLNAFVPVAQTTYNITVGTGGNSNNSSNGTNTTFNTSSLIAKGGNSVATGTVTGATAPTGSTGDVLHDGGSGASGPTSKGGGGGSSGGTGANGRAGQLNVGGGNGTDSANLPAGAGAGGNGAATGSAIGSDGVFPGGAGGGASRNSTTARKAGNGAVGQLILTYTTPPMSALVDNFDGVSLKAQWQLSGPGTPANNIKQVNSELEITTDAVTNDYFTLNSFEFFDLTGSYASMQLVSAGSQLTNQDCVPLLVQLDANNELWFDINSNLLGAHKKVATVSAAVGSNVTYDPNVHKWLRIRESGGTTFWDYSTDGVTWTNLTSITNPIAVTSLQAGLQGGQFGTAVATTFKYDNFNVVRTNFTFTTDGIVKATATKTFTADGMVKVITTATFTADGIITSVSPTFAFTVDGVITQLTEKFSDNFNETVIPIKWNDWGFPNPTLTNNQLVMTSTLSPQYFGMDTWGDGTNFPGHVYDLRGSYVISQLIAAGNSAIPSWEVYPVLVVLDDGLSTTTIQFVVLGTSLSARHVISGGTPVVVATTTYDPNVHKWFKVREAAGTIYWDYSTDGVTWTNFASEAAPFAVNHIRAGIQVGTWQTETLTTSATFDNFNIVRTNFTFTVDGVVKVTGNTKTFTADGVVKVLNNLFTFTADGVVLVTGNTKTFTADGIVKVLNNLFTFTADGIVKQTKTFTFTTDGIVMATTTKTFTADGIVKATTTQFPTISVNESMWTSPSTGTIKNSATWLANYLRLTANSGSQDGEFEYSGVLPVNFEVDFELWMGPNNTGADAIWFYFGCNETITGEDQADANVGYVIAFDEYSGEGKPYIIAFGGVILANTTGGATFADSAWHQAKIRVIGNTITMFLDGSQVLTFTDTTRSLPGSLFGWGARTGGVSNEHRIRNLFVGQLLTMDGLVKVISTATFTTDGIIKATQTFTFTTDGIIDVTGNTKTFTSDGIIKATQVFTFTADGIVKVITTFTFTTDGIVKATQLFTFTADGIIDVTGNTKTFTTDGVVKAQTTFTFTADGVVKATQTFTFTTDGIVKATKTFTFTTDGLVRDTFTKTFTADGVVKATQVFTFTTDGIVLQTKTFTFTSDGIVFATNTKTFTTDGIIDTKGVVFTFTVDGIVKATQTFTVTADGLVRDTFSKTFTTDGIVLATTTKTFTTDGIIFAKNTLAFTADGVIRTSGTTLTFTTDGIIFATNTKTVTADGLVRDTFTKTFTTDGIVLQTKTFTFTTDGIVRDTFTKSFTADGIVKATSTQTITTDGIVKATQIATFTTDGIIITSGNSLTFTADGIVKVFGSLFTFTADGIIKETKTFAFVTDGLVRDTFSKTFTTDGIIRQTKTFTFTVDGEVEITGNTQPFTADGVIKAQTLFTITVDGIILVTTFNPFTVDGIISVAQSKSLSFTTDGLISQTETALFTIDGIIERVQYGAPGGRYDADDWLGHSSGGLYSKFEAPKTIYSPISPIHTEDETPRLVNKELELLDTSVSGSVE